jgi:hypothetical protein
MFTGAAQDSRTGCGRVTRTWRGRKTKMPPRRAAFLTTSLSVITGEPPDAELRGRGYRSRAGRACEPTYGRGARPRPSGAPSFPRASRNNCAASFRETRLRAATSSSGREAPDPHCYRERLLASANRPFDFNHQCWSVAPGPINPSADRQSRSPLERVNSRTNACCPQQPAPEPPILSQNSWRCG